MKTISCIFSLTASICLADFTYAQVTTYISSDVDIIDTSSDSPFLFNEGINQLRVAMSNSSADSTFYFADFLAKEFGGWTATGNIHQEVVEFDESIEMWTMIRPNAESPGSIISPKMLFQTGNYTVKIVARCIELDRQVDVDLNLEGRSIGRLSFTYAKSASTLNFSIGSNTTTSLKITIDGGSSTMLAISEIIVFGPRR